MYYFAYGSNMDADRMHERGIVFSSRVPAILTGAKIVFNKIADLIKKEGFANLDIDYESSTEGVLYKITDSQIKKLDIFEGFPFHYEKWQVQVTADNKKIKAITYLANPRQTTEGLHPSNEYLNHLLAGKDCLSDAYFKMLKSYKNKKSVKFVGRPLPNLFNFTDN